MEGLASVLPLPFLCLSSVSLVLITYHSNYSVLLVYFSYLATTSHAQPYSFALTVQGVHWRQKLGMIVS